MKNKLVKISVVLGAVILAIGTTKAALSEKKSEDPRSFSFLGPETDMPQYEKGSDMVDRQGNHQSCFLDTVHINPGKKMKSVYACWSDKVSN
jgi:hypothetical protein